MKTFAMMVVTMMILVSMAYIVPSPVSDAAGEFPGGGEAFGYILETDDVNISVVSVTVNGSKQSTMGLANWSYGSDGRGPFNTFYAAVNLDDYSTDQPSEFYGETPLSYEAGKIAYILDPYNLKRTLGGTDITSGMYNVMLVIPTVYWYSDAENNKLYMTNDPDYFSGTVSYDNLKPWAHTLKISDTETVVMDYLMIGVYEGYVDGDRLTSQSGHTPTASQNIAAFRTYALNNTAAEDSYYGLWNFYQYTLYKMMAFTVMGSMDSQHTEGLGEGNVWGQNGTGTAEQITAAKASMSGNGDTSGQNGSQGWYGHRTDYSSVQSAEKNMNDQYSKLFIENSWGSVADFVDDVWFYGNKMRVGNNAPILLEEHGGTGLDDTMQSSPTTPISLPTLYLYITGASENSQTWGVPLTSYSDYNIGTLQNDLVISYPPNGNSYCLRVGGEWSYDIGAGVGAFSTSAKTTDGSFEDGTRLAYLASAEEIPVIYFDAAGGSSATISMTAGLDHRLTSLPTASRNGYTFQGWYTSAYGGSEITASTVFHGNTTVHAHWEALPVPIEDDDDWYNLERIRQTRQQASSETVTENNEDPVIVGIAAAAVAGAMLACAFFAFRRN